MAITFADVLRRSGGKAPGVAHTRAVLVMAWIAFGSVRLTNGLAGAVLSPLWIVPFVAVPGLFAVLGFCLAQAAADQSAREFVLDRVRRAGPALLVAVSASALVLGPLATTDSLRAYVSDPAFAQYFLNLVGWPRFELPGVFEFNDYSGVVNEALWLPPFFAIVALSALAAMRSRKPRWLALAGASVTLAVYLVGEIAGLNPSPTGSVFRNSFVANGLAAVFAGQCGILCFLWRDRLPVGPASLAGPIIALGAVALLGGPNLAELPGAPFAIALLAGAGALAAAALRLPGVSWIAARAAPVLLGAMLFSFPLQQLAADLGPGRQSAVINLALSLPVAVALAWALHWITVRTGLSSARAEPEFGELAPALPDIHRLRFWRNLFRQAAAGIGVAVAVAIIGLIVILVTIAAFQRDPIGV